MNFEEFKATRAMEAKETIVRTAWTDEELEYAVIGFNTGMSTKDIGEQVGRAESSVASKLGRMALAQMQEKGIHIVL